MAATRVRPPVDARATFKHASREAELQPAGIDAHMRATHAVEAAVALVIRSVEIARAMGDG